MLARVEAGGVEGLARGRLVGQLRAGICRWLGVPTRPRCRCAGGSTRRSYPSGTARSVVGHDAIGGTYIAGTADPHLGSGSASLEAPPPGTAARWAGSSSATPAKSEVLRPPDDQVRETGALGLGRDRRLPPAGAPRSPHRLPSGQADRIWLKIEQLRPVVGQSELVGDRRAPTSMRRSTVVARTRPPRGGAGRRRTSSSSVARNARDQILRQIANEADGVGHDDFTIAAGSGACREVGSRVANILSSMPAPRSS